MPDIYVTTEELPRTRMQDMLNYEGDYELSISPNGRWILFNGENWDTQIVAAAPRHEGEFGLRVDVDGVILCNSLPETFDEARRELPKLQQPARIHRVNSPIKVVEVVVPPTLDCPERNHIETAVAALEG